VQTIEQMAEELHVALGNKEEKYRMLLPQIEAVLEGEKDEVANMANVAAMLWETFHWWWTGFYRVQGEQLVLGPFQGPMACTRIRKGKGVCGTCWQENQTQLVPDVELFPRQLIALLGVAGLLARGDILGLCRYGIQIGRLYLAQDLLAGADCAEPAVFRGNPGF